MKPMIMDSIEVKATGEASDCASSRLHAHRPNCDDDINAAAHFLPSEYL